MVYLFALTVIGVILITLGLVGLYFDVCRRLTKVEKSMRLHQNDIAKNRRSIRVLKEREAQRADRVIIGYEPKDSGIKFGGEGI